MQTLYNGLNYSTRALVDVACGGFITSKMTKEANRLFDESSKNDYKAPYEDPLEEDKVESWSWTEFHP